MVPRLLVGFLLVTAGCTAADVSGDAPRTTTATTTETAPIETATTPTETETNESNTVAYDDLSATQRRAFDRAVAGQAQFVDESVLDSPYVDGDYFTRETAAPFRTHAYVRKNGTDYGLSYRESGGDAFATYGIRATGASAPDDATVVALANVSAEVRDEVRWAVENGSYTAPAGKWSSLPTGFDEFDYVRHEGETYRISVVYGDRFAAVLHVERAA